MNDRNKKRKINLKTQTKPSKTGIETQKKKNLGNTGLEGFRNFPKLELWEMIRWTGPYRNAVGTDISNYTLT